MRRRKKSASEDVGDKTRYDNENYAKVDSLMFGFFPRPSPPDRCSSSAYGPDIDFGNRSDTMSTVVSSPRPPSEQLYFVASPRSPQFPSPPGNNVGLKHALSDTDAQYWPIRNVRPIDPNMVPRDLSPDHRGMVLDPSKLQPEPIAGSDCGVYMRIAGYATLERGKRAPVAAAFKGLNQQQSRPAEGHSPCWNEPKAQVPDEDIYLTTKFSDADSTVPIERGHFRDTM